MAQVGGGMVGLRMGFRIAAHQHVKRVTVFGADEADQIRGIAKIAGAGHARWHVTTQCNQAFTALGAILRQQGADLLARSEEHTSELQSLMRISYAVFCLKKKKTT